MIGLNGTVFVLTADRASRHYATAPSPAFPPKRLGSTDRWFRAFAARWTSRTGNSWTIECGLRRDRVRKARSGRTTRSNSTAGETFQTASAHILHGQGRHGQTGDRPIPNKACPSSAQLPPVPPAILDALAIRGRRDRKSTRLNSSHVRISYAVFCLKKKKNTTELLFPQNKKKKNNT